MPTRRACARRALICADSALVPAGRFIEVFVDTPPAVCEERDPKGLYQKARDGELRNFTGIDAVYEAPQRPDLHLDGEQLGNKFDRSFIRSAG